MATFQCQACGNLHGAPVEACGMCGNPGVMLVPDGTPPPAGATAPGAAPPALRDTVPPPAAEDFAAALAPLFTEALDYVRSRDKAREDREANLDASETQRRDALNHAKLEFFGQSTTLVEKLTELAESAITYVDTILLKAKNAAQPPQS